MSLLLYIKIVFRQIKNCLWWLINYLKRLILFVFRRQNQQQQQQSNDDDQNENNLQYNLDFVVIDKPLNDGNDNNNVNNNNNNNILSTTIPSILNNPNEQQNSKFPNVQSYTEQDLYNYSNYSLTSIQSKQQQNYSYDLNYTKNRSSSNSGEHQKQQQQQQEIADTVEEPDYFQDMVPEFKKPKTVYVNKHDHPMISSDNNQQNNYDNNDELNNKIEKKFRFKQQQQNQQQQDSSYQFNNNNNIDNDLLSNEPNFTNQFGTIQLSSSSTSMDMNTNQITSWEDMANNDEELWIDTDQQLKTMRQQRREQRLNEHRRQKQLKHKYG